MTTTLAKTQTSSSVFVVTLTLGVMGIIAAAFLSVANDQVSSSSADPATAVARQFIEREKPAPPASNTAPVTP